MKHNVGSSVVVFSHQDHCEYSRLLDILEGEEYRDEALTPAGWLRYGALSMKLEIAEKHGVVDYSGMLLS